MAYDYTRHMSAISTTYSRKHHEPSSDCRGERSFAHFDVRPRPGTAMRSTADTPSSSPIVQGSKQVMQSTQLLD
jgi:hypothetical protein